MLFGLVCQNVFGTDYKVVFKERRPLKRGSIHMKFSMTRQEKGDLLIQVTAWTCLTVFPIFYDLDKLCFNF
jgi:hypothetical protein